MYRVTHQVGNYILLTLILYSLRTVGIIGWLTGNGKKLSNSQACCLVQLCLVAA